MPKIRKITVLISLMFVVTASLSAQNRIGDLEPESLFADAKMLFDNKNYGAAAELFHRYLTASAGQSPQKMVEAAFYEAACSSYLGSGEQQLMFFSQENPTSIFAAKADLLYADMLFKNKKYRDALRKYESVDDESLPDNDRAEYYFKRGLAYYQTNDIEKAAPFFYKSAVMESPYKDDARYYYAHIQYIDGKYEEARYHLDKIADSPKYKDVTPLYLTQIDYIEGKYTSVTTDADVVLDNVKGQRKVELALVTAESWYQQKDYAKALRYYDIASENTRKTFPREVEFHIGFCKMKQLDFEDAVANFQNVTKKINNDELAQYASYYLAQCYMKTGQEKFARNAYLTAYKSDFNHEMSEDALFNYAKLSFISGVDPFNEAVSLLEDFIARHPDSARKDEARTMIIHLYLNGKDYDKAIKSIESLPDMDAEMQKIYAQLTYNIGIESYNAMDYDKAVTYLNKTINNKQGDAKMRAEAYYWLADSYYQKKEYGNAENYYNAFLKIGGSGQSEMLPMAYYNLGYIAYMKGGFNNAIKNFNYFFNMAKDDKDFESDAWMRIGDCYFMERSYNKAIVAYSNAMKLGDANADYALFQQGMGYGAMGDMNAKVRCLESLTSNHAKSSFYDRAIYETGMAHLSSGDERAAIASFDKIVRERPRSAYARQGQMKIGMLYYNGNQYDNALTNLKKVVDNYPNTAEAREALNIMRSIYMEENNTTEFYRYTEEKGIATSVTEQDSVSFATAENFFRQGQYENALKAAQQYAERFPQGAYLLKVNYYGMTSLEKLGRDSETKPYLEYIIAQPDNDYTDNALLKLAGMEKAAGDLRKAKGCYERLLDITENQTMKAQALEGAMECGYRLDDYDDAIARGEELSGMQGLSQSSRNHLNYVVGMSLYRKNNLVEAVTWLEAYANKDRTETGAEAAYHVVLANYKMGKLDETEKKVFDISDNFSNYSYYVAMSFITLSDVYVAKDNVFQAKATLRSIIENYPGGEPKDLAQQKLTAIENDELNNEEETE